MTQTLCRATIAQVRAGRGGRLVEIDDDIFDLAKRLHEIDASLGLDWNDAGGYFRVTQTLENGQKHVVLTCQELTPEIIERVRLVVGSGYDLVGELDRIDRERERERAAPEREDRRARRTPPPRPPQGPRRQGPDLPAARCRSWPLSPRRSSPRSTASWSSGSSARTAYGWTSVAVSAGADARWSGFTPRLGLGAQRTSQERGEIWPGWNKRTWS